MSNMIPKLKELQSTAKDALVAASLFVTASAAITKVNPGTADKSIVLMDTGTSEKTIERHLNDEGICIVVEPIVSVNLRNQSGTEWITDAELLVKVMTNPNRNDTAEGGAGVNIYDAVIEVIKTLHRKARHPGGEFFQLARDAIVLSRFDEGLWTYDVTFTKEVIL